jgi:putative endonuclease
LSPLAPLYRFADFLRSRHVETGERGEDLAHRYLRRHGFRVVARNWRPPQGGGEIDIVAWEGEVLVFIEVKTRQPGTDKATESAPERAVNDDKMTALRRAARDYVRRAIFDDGTGERALRFDVVTIAGMRLQHMKEAFPASQTTSLY